MCLYQVITRCCKQSTKKSAIVPVEPKIRQSSILHMPTCLCLCWDPPLYSYAYSCAYVVVKIRLYPYEDGTQPTRRNPEKWSRISGIKVVVLRKLYRYCYVLQRFSIECRKTKTKVITEACHKGHRQCSEVSEPIKTRIKYM